MDRQTFARRLREASLDALDFARRYIEEPLPDARSFRIRLNGSYDGNPLEGDEVVYPEDSAFERRVELREVTEDEVLATLWRDGRVPEWINLNVIGENGRETLIDAVSCGRFTANDDFLYHVHEGRPPFHVLSPTLPSGYQEGDTFSIYHRSECWTVVELERLERRAGKVWSLDLVGPAFTDRVLAEIHPFPGLEILEMKQARIAGPGLSGLGRLPRLRVLRIHFAGSGRADLTRVLDELGRWPALEELEMTGTWVTPDVLHLLAARRPGLKLSPRIG